MKCYFSAIIFLLSFNLSFSQDSSKTCHSELKHGIQFQIGSLLNLTNFNNYTFSYRYLFNNNSGIRIGLLTNIDESDYDITQQFDSLINKPPKKASYFNLKLSVQYLYSLVSYNRFNLVIGGGPFVSYSKSELYDEQLWYSIKSSYENKDITTGFGLDILLGVEYNLSENIKLSGEYGLSISKEKSDTKLTHIDIYHDGTPSRINKEEGERNRFQTKSLAVNFGISVFL